MIGMLSNWLLTSSLPAIKKIELIFPVVGHSYIPPDRLFGQIEKVIKRTPEVTSPEQYFKIIEKWAKIYRLGGDVPIRDWKSEVQIAMKQPGQWHFKLQMSKRIIISKTKNSIAVRGEHVYRNDLGTDQSLLKRGRKLLLMNPKVAKIGLPVTPDKKNSITKLIEKRYGDKWQNDEVLSFFTKVFSENPVTLTSEGNSNIKIIPTGTEEEEVDENTEKICLEENLDFVV